MHEGPGLPAIVFGAGPVGFGVLSISVGFPDAARLAFLDFAKAVSWRPAKAEARNAVCLALVPSPDGVVACRLTEHGNDAYGRGFAMRIEGVLCRHDDRIWRHFAASSAWPSERISDCREATVGTEAQENSSQIVPWTPASGYPLILAPPALVNAPALWFGCDAGTSSK